MNNMLALPYEVWRDVKDYEGLYQVSNLGRVKSLERYVKHYTGSDKLLSERILKQPITNTGYCIVGLCKNGIPAKIKTHRLIAQAFISNPENKPYIDHINTIKTDNRVENLRWVTHKENMNNTLTKKHHKENNPFKDKYGKDNLRARAVLQYDLNGKFIKEWECAMQVQRELGILHNNITKVCKGERKTAGGFIWKYA